MTAHQRRPGFRLPWSSDADAGDASSTDAAAPSDDTTEPTTADGSADATQATADAAERQDDAAATDAADEPGTDAEATADTTADAAPATAGAERPATDTAPETGMTATSQPTTSDATPADGFLGDLVAAMRRVADEARETTLAQLRARLDEAIREREADAERRRNDIRSQAEKDIAAVGDWAKAEAERIKAEAEQRVASRRARLDEELAAEASHVDSTADSLRSRIADYERQLEKFNEELSSITDPAAFAAAAKRMPPPPALDGSQPAADAAATAEAAATADAATTADPAADEAETHAPGTNGSTPAEAVAEPAAELEELDASPGATAAAEPEKYAEPVATEIVVKGLGSFGAITGFRQQLANVEGIDAVGLSLGTSGEFVFRATHRPSMDMAAAIAALEGDAVEIEPRAEGGIRVTLGRPR